MKKTIHKANTRGIADFGWLHSHHTFSFSSYYNPNRMQFGALRVLNDDIVQPAMGFGAHGHENMEIVSIPIIGELAHKDSMGTAKVIYPGEVQIMSAGTGLRHSEYNNSETNIVNFLQIWILPKERGIKPRYDQREFLVSDRNNNFQTVVSPEKDSNALWINQDSYFSLANLEKGKSIDYKIKLAGNGAYLFLIDGSVSVDGETFEKRDGVGIAETDSFSITANENAEILLIEVPMI
ncbi:MAG: pirin family protein [Leptospiraceae bacterium]|nr:pirin family protein [Leptospiraceae bacterium]MBK7053731.1 pirin family protein [Leptospiraceae bacterium]MBK9500144.1 pirin family protein [Leptospiraceae bacterium]